MKSKRGEVILGIIAVTLLVAFIAEHFVQRYQDKRIEAQVNHILSAPIPQAETK